MSSYQERKISEFKNVVVDILVAVNRADSSCGHSLADVWSAVTFVRDILPGWHDFHDIEFSDVESVVDEIMLT